MRGGLRWTVGELPDFGLAWNGRVSAATDRYLEKHWPGSPHHGNRRLALQCHFESTKPAFSEARDAAATVKSSRRSSLPLSAHTYWLSSLLPLSFAQASQLSKLGSQNEHSVSNLWSQKLNSFANSTIRFAVLNPPVSRK